MEAKDHNYGVAGDEVAEEQTCQAARPRSSNGATVRNPVMIRSRVSWATGWIASAGGPVSFPVAMAASCTAQPTLQHNGACAPLLPFSAFGREYPAKMCLALAVGAFHLRVSQHTYWR